MNNTNYKSGRCVQIDEKKKSVVGYFVMCVRDQRREDEFMHQHIPPLLTKGRARLTS